MTSIFSAAAAPLDKNARNPPTRVLATDRGLTALRLPLGMVIFLGERVAPE